MLIDALQIEMLTTATEMLSIDRLTTDTHRHAPHRHAYKDTDMLTDRHRHAYYTDRHRHVYRDRHRPQTGIDMLTTDTDMFTTDMLSTDGHRHACRDRHIDAYY